MSLALMILILTEKLYTYPLNTVFFFMLLTVESFEIFPKHNGYDFISDCFELADFYTIFLSGVADINRIFSLFHDCSII